MVFNDYLQLDVFKRDSFYLQKICNELSTEDLIEFQSRYSKLTKGLDMGEMTQYLIVNGLTKEETTGASIWVEQKLIKYFNGPKFESI